MEEDKEIAIERENGYAGSGSGIAKKPTFMQRYKAHMKKWWWLHVIIIIAVALIVTLPLVYVGFPRIAQQGVDDATIEVTDLQALDPTPTSFHFVQQSLSHSYNMYHPFLEAFNGSLALAGSAPYCLVELAAITSGTSVPAPIDQIVQITDLQAFTDYNTALFSSESIQVRVNGSTWLHEMALPATYVHYDKMASLKGFNNLPGFNLTKFNLMDSPDAEGNNVNGTVFIPNPTVISFDLGNVTYNAFVNDTLIGNTTIHDLRLLRGNHTYPFAGYTNQTALAGLLGSYPDFKIPVRIVGESVVFNGQHLTYYEAALKQSVQHVLLDLKAILGGGGGGQ